MTGSNDPVEFLRARLDEDEAAARAAVSSHERAPRMSPCRGGAMWFARDDEDDYGQTVVVDADGHVVVPLADSGGVVRAHVARWDPARVLAEVAAKRNLIDDLCAEPHGMSKYDARFRCGAAQDEYGNQLAPDDVAARTDTCDCGRDEHLYRRIRFLALPYADRPDFPEELRQP